MAFTAYIPVAWIPAIHAGMTPDEIGVRLLLIKKNKANCYSAIETVTDTLSAQLWQTS
jgi:hypothetical protein